MGRVSTAALRNAVQRKAAAEKVGKKTWTITVPRPLPSFNIWDGWSYHEQTRQKNEIWWPLVQKACHGLKFKKIPTPCTLRITVYRKLPGRGDVLNLGTPADKLVVDALTRPKGPKWRGVSLLLDDNYDNLRAVTLTMRTSKREDECTVLEFKKVVGA